MKRAILISGGLLAAIFGFRHLTPVDRLPIPSSPVPVLLAQYVPVPFTSAAVSFNAGFDFRGTSGFVTDPPNTTWVLADAYPTTRSIGGTNVTFGWESGALSCSDAVSAVDRSAAVDARLAGINYDSAGGTACSVFRVDLPSSGTYNVSLAQGDEAAFFTLSGAFYDNSSLLFTVTSSQSSVAACEFFDATGTLQTSCPNWVSNETPKSLTFGSTIFRWKQGNSSGVNTIAHIRIQR